MPILQATWRARSARWLIGVCAIVAGSAQLLAQELPAEFRTNDGSNNNLAHPEWGSVGVELLRMVPPAYSDGVSAPAGASRPSARAISNAVAAQAASIPNGLGISDFVWLWAEFVGNDLDLAATATPVEEFDIPVPTGDAFFDPGNSGTQVIAAMRSMYKPNSVPRQQTNQVTAWIDASTVYGSDDERAAELRAFRRGMLASGHRRLLPMNGHGFANSPSTDKSFFLAGDVRANEDNALTAMHALFVREHNRIVRSDFRLISDQSAYLIARALVAAEIQAITYKEFLPILLGPNALRPYSGYLADVNAGITTEFATAAFRFGQSLVSPVLLRLKPNGSPIAAGNLALRDAFFNPHEITRYGIDWLLRGLATQPAQAPDSLVVDDLRNFLFGAPGAGGSDLAALTIQRGRDHGLPNYNTARMLLGLGIAHSFADISSDLTMQVRLATIYKTVDDVDLWVGGMAEDRYNGGLVGRLFFTIIRDQFERLRDGDRFWYEIYLAPYLRTLYVDNTRLADVIRRNTRVRTGLQDNVFLVP